ncbi:MAG TPA: hypothetical protein PK629_09890 [Oscillospiraceae bacterium]|nr:hypothetical protein [Oscillospiraceae bacterium]HPF54923.1 hypothetical protein [Clostridiales bacterium]HPK34982.1 hypothetical protein [Oscillospiraceae bacterium]HPR75540.1 hypothetical protein [Oscillospiraceae bacterium]
MINKNKLLQIITRNGYNQSSFAAVIGMNRSTFSTKLNGCSSFTLEQVEDICSILKINDPLEKCEIFLCPWPSQFCDTKKLKGKDHMGC